jgi:2-polyprenyl-6-methoxyphenol hydroxylase-like FAD-dependent oxidoreductase
VSWFAAGPELTRLYLLMTAQRLRETGVDRSFDALLAYATSEMPEGSLTSAAQAGPIGYFSSSDTWASVIAGNGVVLIGDAAGSPDPCQGQGTSLLYHDVRLLRELLTTETDWDAAASAYATERVQLFDVVHAWDRWHDPIFERSDTAARLREGHERARQADPTLGGFAFIERKGPYGLVGNDTARGHFFGEDL